MAIYESIVILDSLIPPKEIDEALERFSAIISENKGKVRQVEKWGKKRMAYELQKKQYGFYASIEFEGEGSIPDSLQSEYNYNDNVLRYLTYRYDKDKLKLMEAAAKDTGAVKSDPVVESKPEQKPEPKPAVEPVVKEIVEEQPVIETEQEEAQAPAESEKTAEENKEE